MFDMKTITFGYIISNALITVFVALLWYQNRRRYSGLGFWLADYVLQVVGLALNSLRGVLPPFVFILLANTLIMGGIFVLFVGLERFVGKPGRQTHNYLLLAVFIGLLAYFTYIQANISIRTGIISAGILLLSVQCSDLLLRRVEARLKPITRDAGIVFLAYALVGLARIVFLVLDPLAPAESWFQAPEEQTLAILVFQMLSIALTFALIMMVTRRLWLERQEQEAVRRQAEEAIEQLARFPSENPHPVLRVGGDGVILYANRASVPLLDEWGCQVGQALPSQWQTLIREVMSKGAGRNVEAQADARVFSLTLTPVVEAGYLNIYGLDITERKDAEIDLRLTQESLRETNQELTQALRREKRFARHDGLTGVYNRRHFFELAIHEFAVSRRYRRPLSMIIFDIDYFKKVNDTFGHQVGDGLLKRVAKIAREQLREADILARYGGDEFAVLLPASNARDAAIVARRIRETVAACHVDTKAGKASVTISIGISECDPDGCSMDRLVQEADTAMYAAKEAGRNHAVIFGRE